MRVNDKVDGSAGEFRRGFDELRPDCLDAVVNEKDAIVADE